MKSLTIALSFILATSAMSQNATFDVTRNGTTPAMDSAIDYALDIWSNCLVSDVPIKINVNHFNMTSAGPLGITFPNGRMNFPNAPEPDTWYPTCLANAMNGTELNPGEVDMDIFMNGYWDWYLGTDGNCPADRYDFVSVFLHEIGHGLGFMSLAKVDDEKGAFGTLTALDFLPLMSSFPFPDLDGFPSVLDRYYVTPAGNRLTDTIQYQNNSTILGVLMRNNNLFYDGHWGVLTNDSTQPKIYAPSEFAIGTSCTHFDENTFPSGHESSLMTPFIQKGEVQHWVGTVTMGVFKDIGWQVNHATSIEEVAPQIGAIKVYPNPTKDKVRLEVTLQQPAHVQLSIFNLAGEIVSEITNRELASGTHRFSWDGTGFNGTALPDSIYLYEAIIGEQKLAGKIHLAH